MEKNNLKDTHAILGNFKNHMQLGIKTMAKIPPKMWRKKKFTKKKIPKNVDGTLNGSMMLTWILKKLKNL